MYDCSSQRALFTYKFTGKERDEESGLDNFKARYFGSSMGRFSSPDPDNAGAWEADPQSWNAYAYARNNPLLFTDRDGEAFEVCQTDEKGEKVNCAVVRKNEDFQKFQEEQKDLAFEDGKIFATNADGTGGVPNPVEKLIAHSVCEVMEILFFLSRLFVFLLELPKAFDPPQLDLPAGQQPEQQPQRRRFTRLRPLR